MTFEKISETLQEQVSSCKSYEDLVDLSRRSTNLLDGCDRFKSLDASHLDNALYKHGASLINFIHREGGLQLYASREVLVNNGTVVTDRLLSLAYTRALTVDETVKLINRYNLKDGDWLWISDKNKFFVGNKEVKPGKLLKAINPTLDDNVISNIIDQLRLEVLDITENISIMSVNDAYNSDDMKISSCMIGRNMSIYNMLGVTCAVYRNDKGHILARSLVYDGKYYGRVYATSTTLEGVFIKALGKRGITSVPLTHTMSIKADKISTVDSRLFIDGEYTSLPFMDRCMYMHVSKDQTELRFTCTSASQFGMNKIGKATSTGGSLVGNGIPTEEV